MRLLIIALLFLVGIGAAPAMAAECDGIYGAGQVCGNNGSVPAPPQPIPARTSLTGNASYYVNGNSGGTATCGPAGSLTCSAGNDSNNCLSPAAACLTAQRAINIIINNIDNAGFASTIYLAHGSSANYAFTCTGGPVIGQSSLLVFGDSNAPTATTIIPPASGGAVSVKDGCTVEMSFLAFADNATNNGTAFITAGLGGYGHVDLSTLTFGSMTIGAQMTATYAGSITTTGPITINGGAALALVAVDGGVIDFSSQTVTVSGTPAYSTAFAFMLNGGAIANASNTTFSGAATGVRCIIDQPIALGGFNPNAVFPGNSDCVANEYIGAIGLQTGAGGSSSFDYGTAGHALLSGGSNTAKNTWDSAGVSCPSGITAGTVTVVAGIVTHC